MPDGNDWLTYLKRFDMRKLLYKVIYNIAWRLSGLPQSEFNTTLSFYYFIHRRPLRAYFQAVVRARS